MHAVERDIRAQIIFKMAPCMPLRHFLEEETPLILFSNTYIFSFKQGMRSNRLLIKYEAFLTTKETRRLRSLRKQLQRKEDYAKGG